MPASVTVYETVVAPGDVIEAYCAGLPAAADVWAALRGGLPTQDGTIQAWAYLDGTQTLPTGVFLPYGCVRLTVPTTAFYSTYAVKVYQGVGGTLGLTALAASAAFKVAPPFRAILHPNGAAAGKRLRVTVYGVPRDDGDQYRLELYRGGVLEAWSLLSGKASTFSAAMPGSITLPFLVPTALSGNVVEFRLGKP